MDLPQMHAVYVMSGIRYSLWDTCGTHLLRSTVVVFGEGGEGVGIVFEVFAVV